MQKEPDGRVGCQNSLPGAAGQTPVKLRDPGRQQPALQAASEALHLLHGFSTALQPPCPSPLRWWAGGLEAFSQRSNLTAPVGMFTARCHLRSYQPPSLSPTALA